jgi:hypothetical protein
MFSPRTTQITIENFGEIGYSALSKDENTCYNSCVIHQLTNTPLAGFKYTDKTDNISVLNNNITTRFYCFSRILQVVTKIIP